MSVASSHSHIFPEEWPIRRLDIAIKEGDVVLGRGRIISKPYMSEHPGPYPVYSSAAINEGLFGHCSDYMFDEELITWSVDGGGKFFYRSRHRFSVTNVSGFMKVMSNHFDYRFLHAALDYQHSKLQFDYTSKAHPSVIEKLYYVPQPPLPEQRKIAEILSTVDETIEKTDAIIQETQQLKKGLMRKLFREGIGHTRFKETKVGRIPEEWSIQRIGDFITEFRGGASLTPSDFVEVGTKVLPKVGVVPGGILSVSYDKQQYCSTAYAEDNRNAMVNQAYIIVVLRDLVPSGPSIGLMVRIPNDETYILAQGVYGFKIDKASLSEDYLIQLSNCGWYRRYMQRILVGSTQVHIRNSEFRDVLIPYPDIAEQQRITEILSEVDTRIKTEKAYKAELEQLKTGLMQVLLSGRVRVEINE